LGAGENRIRRIIALIAATIALACLPFAGNRPLFLSGYFLLVIAGLLMTPFLSLSLARLLRRPMRWLRPVEGALAADSLIQAPRRTSATVAALMLSLALVVGQGGVARGSLVSIEEWMNNTLNPDLFLSTTQNIASQGAHFPASMQHDVESVPGVAEVQAVRMPRIQFHKLPVMLVTVEIEKMARRVKRHMVAGDETEMNRQAAAGKGVILSENLAALAHLRLGDTVEIPAPAETLRLPVAGIIRDLSNQMGAIIMDRSVYIRAFRDDSVDVYRVYLTSGTSVPDARTRIIAHLGQQRHMFVLSNREIRDYIGTIMNQWFGLTYLQVIVAMLVSILGIINTLTVSISDRRRELGVLRAVGGLRNQIRGTVWMEALAIGAIGLILGVVIGAINLYYELQVIQHDLTGIPLSYEFPLAIVAMLVPIILGTAFASAILPAETAVRSSLVEALEYE
jgi:putative ABC transport system permease protein